jgi:general secretion pathway protein C
MNLNIDFSKWRLIRPLEWFGRAYLFLPIVLSFFLILTISNTIASITWKVIYFSPTTLSTIPERNKQIINIDTASRLDINVITSKNLFGSLATPNLIQQPKESNYLNTPETALNLQLKGVLFDEDQGKSVAIVLTESNEEKVFKINDVITDNGTTILHSIHEDRIIINRGGVLEALTLPKSLEANSESLNIAIQTNQISNQSAMPIRNVISNNISSLTDIIRIAPHIQDGEMIGFRLSPGASQNQFETLGLQSGDVILDINGTAMTDPSNALQVFESLNEATYASLTILRNGNRQVISLDTSQFQELEAAL